jgi:hypothetical protein
MGRSVLLTLESDIEEELEPSVSRHPRYPLLDPPGGDVLTDGSDGLHKRDPVAFDAHRLLLGDVTCLVSDGVRVCLAGGHRIKVSPSSWLVQISTIRILPGEKGFTDETSGLDTPLLRLRPDVKRRWLDAELGPRLLHGDRSVSTVDEIADLVGDRRSYVGTH